jgi:hypothetical protein
VVVAQAVGECAAVVAVAIRVAACAVAVAEVGADD